MCSGFFNLSNGLMQTTIMEVGPVLSVNADMKRLEMLVFANDRPRVCNNLQHYGKHPHREIRLFLNFRLIQVVLKEQSLSDSR